MKRLSSTKPFLFTAYYNWLLDNEITPHLLVDASVKGVKVPEAYVKNGSIILSLTPSAISDYQCLKSGIAFKARFHGVSEDIFVPYAAMDQLIALETGAALPIGRALEQLDLGDADQEIYPDEGELDSESLFSLDDDSVDESEKKALSDEERNLKDRSKDSEGASKPGFSFVDD